MNINEYLDSCKVMPGEKPLDRIPLDGGFCSIFRTIGCIGDSLSSGEFEAINSEGKKSYHDYFEYSWGQYIARQCGSTVYNFSRGGMTAKAYWNGFAETNGYWDEDKLCQAYIIALGVNDICNQHMEVGTTADINLEDYNQNGDTFAGYYARIIQRLKSMQPDAHFFLMTMPRSSNQARNVSSEAHRKILFEIAALFENMHIIDLYQYAPVYDEDFRMRFYLRGHLNPMGYIFTARMVAAYIDYIVRENPVEFCTAGFIGKELPEDVKELNRKLAKGIQ